MTKRVTRTTLATQRARVARYWAWYKEAHKIIMDHEIACAIHATTGQAPPATPHGLAIVQIQKNQWLRWYEQESRILEKMRVA